MKNKAILICALFYLGCNAMDSQNLINKQEDSDYKNKLEQMDKNNERAFKLLENWCAKSEAYKIAKIPSKKGFMICITLQDTNKDEQQITELVNKKLIKKSTYFSGYIIPYPIHDHVLSLIDKRKKS